MLDADRQKWETVMEQWRQICDVCGTPTEGQSHNACRLSSYEDTLQLEEE